MKFVFFVFFPVSENGENGLGDEGADGGNAPRNFWARTAPEKFLTENVKFVHIIEYIKICVFFPKRIIRLIRTKQL